MINWRLLKHPVNWLTVGAVMLFWLMGAYLVASGVSKHSVSSQNNGVNQ